jgi:hypothetical protein
MTIANDPIADDLIWGGAAIGREIGVNDAKRALYLLERRNIPARKIGRIRVASRRELRAILCGPSASEVRAGVERPEHKNGLGDLSSPRRGRPLKRRVVAE